MSAAAATSSDAVVQIVALVVGLVQTIALAVIADRSRRVRAVDRQGPSRNDGAPHQRRASDRRATPVVGEEGRTPAPPA